MATVKRTMANDKKTWLPCFREFLLSLILVIEGLREH